MPENLRKHLVYFNMKVIAGNIIAGFITILLIQLVIPVHGQAVTRIWYTSAAANFNEALPLEMAVLAQWYTAVFHQNTFP